MIRYDIKVELNNVGNEIACCVLNSMKDSFRVCNAKTECGDLTKIKKTSKTLRPSESKPVVSLYFSAEYLKGEVIPLNVKATAFLHIVNIPSGKRLVSTEYWDEHSLFNRNIYYKTLKSVLLKVYNFLNIENNHNYSEIFSPPHYDVFDVCNE